MYNIYKYNKLVTTMCIGMFSVCACVCVCPFFWCYILYSILISIVRAKRKMRCDTIRYDLSFIAHKAQYQPEFYSEHTHRERAREKYTHTPFIITLKLDAFSSWWKLIPVSISARCSDEKWAEARSAFCVTVNQFMLT